MDSTHRDGWVAMDTYELQQPRTLGVRPSAWNDLPWLKAAFSTRAHGVSQVYGPDEQNLGWTLEDDAAHVRRNRRDFLKWLTGDAEATLRTVQQVHSGTVWLNDGMALHEARPAEDQTSPEADGLVGKQAGQFLGILTADCVPILMADTRTRAVAALHAGWRGTLARIAERGVEAMQAAYHSRPEDLIAAIGPAIRPCCFEVGEEVRSAFQRHFAYADTLFTAQPVGGAEPRLRPDLQMANQRQLLAAGLSPGNIDIVRECTACCRVSGGVRKYFSYRAEGGVTGRMMSVIGTV